MSDNKLSGDAGEKEVVDLVPCPNCFKKLMLLPTGYPLYDVQCTGCSFRAQVKTNMSKPKDQIFGATWEIMDKVAKSGYMVPSLIANFKWLEAGETKQEIRFYPFVPKKNLKMYKLSKDHKQPNLKMFRYVGLSKLPFFTLFKK